MLQLPGTCLGATASDGCQEGCEEGHEEGGEEVSAGAWWLPNRVSRMVFHGIQMNPGCSESVPAKRDVGDTSCIASLESGGFNWIVGSPLGIAADVFWPCAGL